MPGSRAVLAGRVPAATPQVATEDDIRAIVQATPLPVNVLFQPDGMAIGALAALGVQRVSYGSLLYRAALRTAVTVAKERRAPAGVPSYAEVQRLLG